MGNLRVRFRPHVRELPGFGLPHDVIDVQQPGGDIDLVHSILVDLIERPD